MPRFLIPVLALAALSALLILPAAAPATAFDDGDFRTGDFAVDALHSSAIFAIEHLGVARFYGRFNSVNGSFRLDLEDIAQSHVQLEIATASVDTNSEGRDRHARSEELLFAEEHPTLSFVSSSVSRVADDRLAVSGTITLRGVSQELSTEVELVGAGDTFMGDFRTGVEARFSVNRGDFGISGVPGGLGNRVDFIVSLEGILATPEGDDEEG